MSAPENTTYVDGGAPVTGDGLNTFVQTVNTMSDLRSFVGLTGMTVLCLGQNSVDDGQGGNFFWNANGTASDDNGVTTVVPSGAGSGVWTRLTLPSPNSGAGGVWTPTLMGATTAGSPSYTVQYGYYRQVGSIVTAFFDLTLSSLGGIAGLIEIAGLPLTANASTQNNGGAFITDYSALILNTGCFSVSGVIAAGTSYMLLSQHGLNSSPNVTEANLTATAHFRGVAIYQSP